MRLPTTRCGDGARGELPLACGASAGLGTADFVWVAPSRGQVPDATLVTATGKGFGVGSQVVRRSPTSSALAVT